MSTPLDPEATQADPGAVETVDALGERGRRARENAREARAVGHEAGPAERPAVRIGRYQMLELVGSGGMGMVLAAWDPELERRVALKLVRKTSLDARERILREGQILARLSHPNIVPVFDVGVVDEQVYLVMEFVRGTTLRAFAAGAPGRAAVLDAYRQAAAGLAEAHRAGVIHRDFKPDNAIIGSDKRVRVLDFGIAHAGGGEDLVRTAGTPKYMAPEQRDELAVLTPSVDQHAYCVALAEALEANGGVPGWIATVVQRGTAQHPADRFPSFDALLDELGRDPAKRRRRIALIAGGIVAATSAFVIGQRSSASGSSIEPCTGGAAAFAQTWAPGIRAQIIDHLSKLGPRGGAEGVRLAGELDEHARVWIADHRAACLARERNEVTPERYAAQLGCFERSQAQVGAVTEILTSVDRPGLDAALFAARMISDVHACIDVSDAVAPPPAAVAPQVSAAAQHIERAQLLVAAYRDSGTAAANAAVTEARATGYAPVIARALMAKGRVLDADANVALAALDESVRLALGASDDILAVEAYARWLYVHATKGAPSTDNLGVMMLIAERLGSRGRFARALLLNNVGIAHFVKNERAEARQAFERAASVARDAPEIELAVVGQNLANLETTAAASLARLRPTYERYLSALGADHPQTILLRTILGAMTPDRAAALRHYGGCSGLEGRAAAECFYEAAWIADEDGDVAQATAWMRQFSDPESPFQPIAAAYLELRSARVLRPETVAGLEKIAAGPLEPIYNRVYVADALIVLAIAATSRADADARWQRATEVLEPADLAFFRRRRARSASELAKRWADARPVEARAMADRALAWYRDATGVAAGDVALVRTLESISSARGSR